MASEKQIAANRRNAQRSTGPRTAAGKSVSSRNAFRHGLSLPPDGNAKVMIAHLAQAIIEKEPALEFADVMEWATAQWDMHRIKQVRRAHLAELDPDVADAAQLERIIATDRYIARAQTRRRRASSKLKSDGG